ncbi:DUF1365 domain-containing protein [Actinophytocola oryzae]|uniref:DUF1365 family protein n=1 Tax=Actinophytocola oryzae TaxID=502181 RepID=A0A4R7VVR0_9PSEU|nr:DUF1365 domain-containing protein [Actinophytocola oryzae]TDV53718.1 hypothetical protein CLV71_104186 [Actinophytocola oryzae]
MILYSARLTHVRHRALSRKFTHSMKTWLVDLDDMPRSRLLEFRAADHLGSPDRPIRENLNAWLATQGIAAPARVSMLTTPRTFGYAFNPLTVYWCYDDEGTPVCVVAEVHNTYGERHCYLLRPDERWRAGVGKEFYVSPFLEVSGHYRMRLPPPDERLSLTVVLHQDGEPAFTATLTGRRVGVARPALVLREALFLLPQRVRFLIQRHGVTLWLRGLPVVRRQPHFEV